MNRTFSLKLAAGALWSFVLTFNLLAQDLVLPAPKKSGGMPLMKALAKRATTKGFDSRELSRQQLSDLLWAAFGVNRPDGKRTAPSAHDQRATELYVLLRQGAYVYDPSANKLNLLLAEDIRKLGATQDFATNAPVTMIFIADLSKMGTDSLEVKTNLANINVGYISQNAYLYCASEGLATGARMSLDRKAVSQKLGLRPSQLILLAQSVGYPPKLEDKK